MILATWFTFIVEGSYKNIHFLAKMAWPPATYNVVCRNLSKWPSLNLSKNLREGWMNSYWKRQVLVFYPLGKKLRKTLGRWHPPKSRPPSRSPPPHPLVRPRVNFLITGNQLSSVVKMRTDKTLKGKGWWTICGRPRKHIILARRPVL